MWAYYNYRGRQVGSISFAFRCVIESAPDFLGRGDKALDVPWMFFDSYNVPEGNNFGTMPTLIIGNRRNLGLLFPVVSALGRHGLLRM